MSDHLSVAQIDALMQRLSMTVAALHSVGVIHGHLMPDNIHIIKEPGGGYRGVLGGLDRSFFKNVGPGSDADVCMAECTAPELSYYVACGGGEPIIPLHEPLAVFVLGLIYHEYLTGWLPLLDHERDLYLYDAMLDGEIISLSPKLMPAHRLLLNRMLTALPYDRLQDCAEVADAIGQIRRRYDTEFRLTVRCGDEPLADKRVGLWAHFKSSAEVAELRSVCLYMGRAEAKGQVVFRGLTDGEYTLRIDNVELPITWEKNDVNRYSCCLQIETV